MGSLGCTATGIATSKSDNCRSPATQARRKHRHIEFVVWDAAWAGLPERFQTRLQSVRPQPPENEVRAQFLARRRGAPITFTRQIAEQPKGNGRAALADLEIWMG